MQDILYILYRLLRTAIGTQSAELSPEDEIRFHALGLEQWHELIQLAIEQNVAAVSLDGFEQICSANPYLQLIIQDNDDDTSILKWNSYRALTECQYKNNVKAIQQLTGLYSKHGINMLVFKGYSMSLEYPVPSHRLCGDIDCFLYSIVNDGSKETIVQKTLEGDRLVEDFFNIKVEKGSKHNIFKVRNIDVENHSIFLFTKRIPEIKHAENLLHPMASNGIPDKQAGCFIPSVEFSSILLPLHFAKHYVFRGSNIKQLLDWAVFVNRHKDEINWELLLSTADEIGCRNFIESINLCIADELGVDRSGLPTGNATPADLERINNELVCKLPALGSSFLHKLKKYRIWLRRYHTVYKGSLLRYFLLNYK